MWRYVGWPWTVPVICACALVLTWQSLDKIIWASPLAYLVKAKTNWPKLFQNVYRRTKLVFRIWSRVSRAAYKPRCNFSVPNQGKNARPRINRVDSDGCPVTITDALLNKSSRHVWAIIYGTWLITFLSWMNWKPQFGEEWLHALQWQTR